MLDRKPKLWGQNSEKFVIASSKDKISLVNKKQTHLIRSKTIHLTLFPRTDVNLSTDGTDSKMKYMYVIRMEVNQGLKYAQFVRLKITHLRDSCSTQKMTKQGKWHVLPAETKISLGIQDAQSSLSA